jgi:hypothetical protein
MQVTVKLSDAELLLVSTELERVMYIEEPTLGWDGNMHEGRTYDCADNPRVCNTEEECESLHTCCGSCEWSYTLPDGRQVWLGFDYGH